MDDSDLATRHEEMMLEVALKVRKPEQIHNGLCLNCGDPVANGGIFCLGDGCSTDWAKIENARIRNGR